MDQFKELRAHPKMTKALLEQIESLQKQNHTTDEISATLGITPESVQRGDEKLNDKHRADPLRALGQLGVQTLGLGLAHIAIRDAADRAGQTLALAGLKQHHQNEDEAGQQL